MRERIIQSLRKAGQQIGDLDAKYAQAVDDRFGLSAPGAGMAKNMVGLTSAAPIRDVFAPGQADTAAEKAILMGMDAGVLATNVAARYALPAAGVTLAGKGLYDLTQLMMDQQTSGTIEPQ
jgi:hypothetical protein